jgi:hypothetical protein
VRTAAPTLSPGPQFRRRCADRNHQALGDVEIEVAEGGPERGVREHRRDVDQPLIARLTLREVGEHPPVGDPVGLGELTGETGVAGVRRGDLMDQVGVEVISPLADQVGDLHGEFVGHRLLEQGVAGGRCGEIRIALLVDHVELRPHGGHRHGQQHGGQQPQQRCQHEPQRRLLPWGRPAVSRSTRVPR